MKADIGVDADSWLVHTLTGTTANAHDVTQACELQHGEEADVYADSGYRGAHKHDEISERHANTRWHVAMMPGKRRALDKNRKYGGLLNEVERMKARIQAKVEHLFRVLKRQVGFRRAHYWGLAKNTAQLHVLFALSNLWMVRKRIFQLT